jgi:hypothetical protein
VNEHDYEPIEGLPDLLPQGERILWRGAPAWWSLAIRAMHVRLVLVYFALLMAWSLVADLTAGVAFLDAVLTASMLVPVALAAAGILALYAWLAHRGTVYTITNRRVVMRYGVALPITVNLPFAIVENAALKVYGDGTGDIPLRLDQDERVSYFLLWPNVRSWRAAKPEPMLRSIPDAEAVAQILSNALAVAAKERGVPETQLETWIENDSGTGRRHAPVAA